MKMQTLIEQWEAMSEREQDAWIAENWMGYKIVPPNTTFWKEDAPFPFLMYDEELKSHCLFEMFDDGWPFTMFNPTSDISAAIEVVNKMREKEYFRWFGLDTHGKQFRAIFRIDDEDNDWIEAFSDEPAKAICTAAYLTLMQCTNSRKRGKRDEQRNSNHYTC
jgi:hypothetical protein